MNNLSNIIKMIDLLSTGKKYTVKELSVLLGVSERMVRYYKEKLNDVGIYIDSYLGSDGGYVLYKKINYYNQLNKYDIRLLKELDLELDKSGKSNRGLKIIIEKLDLIDIISDNDNIYDVIINDSDKNSIVNQIEDAISKNIKLKIIYENIEGINRQRVVKPYQIFKHDNRLYVVCFCEYKQDFRHFEISRIKIIK